MVFYVCVGLGLHWTPSHLGNLYAEKCTRRYMEETPLIRVQSRTLLSVGSERHDCVITRSIDLTTPTL